MLATALESVLDARNYDAVVESLIRDLIALCRGGGFTILPSDDHEPGRVL